VPKLNQIVAVVSGKKTRVEKEFGDLYKVVQKPDLFHGLSRTYQPVDDGGEQLPSESKQPQKSSSEIVDAARATLVGIIDAIATQEWGNTTASADVFVGGKALLNEVPITVLLYLEKQLTDLYTFVNSFPVLDPAEEWQKNDQNGQYRTPPTKTVRTKKVQKPLVLYPATDKHPAQTQLITEDVTVGYWTTVKTATVFSAQEKKGILARIQELQDAVKVAREAANSVDVDDVEIAAPILKYVFGA
jgi:hypothetical protein